MELRSRSGARATVRPCESGSLPMQPGAWFSRGWVQGGGPPAPLYTTPLIAYSKIW